MSYSAFARFQEKGKEIVALGEKRGIPVRLIGAIAVRLHCDKHAHLLESMKRQISDIDVVTYSNFRSKIEGLLTELGYSPNERFNAAHRTRHIYGDKNNSLIVDVFFDKLEMCHVIDFKDRLELDYPTITPTDILIEKVQIVEINEKDVKDIIVLLREHDVGHGEKEMINSKYIAKLLSNSWGFYYTSTTNLNKVKRSVETLDVLNEEDRRVVFQRIDKLLGVIEKEPKGFQWKMREKIGTKKKWYTDVCDQL